MNNAQVIKKFASGVITLAQQAKTIAAAAQNLYQMKKSASAEKAAVELNDAKLTKAASAVAAIYGDRASVNADSLKQIWSANHNTIVDSLVKVASDLQGRTAEKSEKLVSVKKQASAKPAVETSTKASHQSAFEQAFGIVR